MKIHHMRNATMLLTLGEHRILVDPMLSPPGALAGFKLFGGGRKNNPLVPMPENATPSLDLATAVLITHEHPDHLDPAGLAWIKERKLPVYASSLDAPNLRSKGLDAHELVDGMLGMEIEVIPAQHGPGVFGYLMGPVSGFYLSHPSEPSIYITADGILNDTVLDVLNRLKPDIVVAPAGSANFGAGPDILFSVDELVTIVKNAPKVVVLNHLEALDHCPTTREGLKKRMQDEGLIERVRVPDDGDSLEFGAEYRAETHPKPKPSGHDAPGLQKWLTSWLA